MRTAFDELAERIRALGEYTPVSYGEMAKLSTIMEETGRPDWKQMVETLAKAQEEVAKSVREVLRIAEDIGGDATADAVTPHMALHEKTALMLCATAS